MRLLVADVVEREDHPVVKKISLVRVPLRLGSDVFNGGAISAEKQELLGKALHAFRLLAEVNQVRQLRCCATSALREASNGQAVVAAAEGMSGVRIEPIDGTVEADLIVNTFWTQDLLKDRHYLYIDVGGGSTELTLIDHGKRRRSASFRIGTVRTLQGRNDPQAWVELAAFAAEAGQLHRSLPGIGTGGNINRLFKENRNAFGEPLSMADIRKQRDRIAGFSLEDRVKKLRLRPDRADVIIPAADIFLSIMEQAGVEEVFVPKVGLADGMVYDMYMRDGGRAKYPHLAG